MISVKSCVLGFFGQEEGAESMGGSGSGRYFYGSVGDNGKELADRQRSIDIHFMKKRNMLNPGYTWSLAWSRNGQPTGDIRGVTYKDRIVLLYRCRFDGGPWQDVKQPVLLTYTPCTYGGTRPWFLCPGVSCDRRAGKLYCAGRLFLCRQCYDLAYRSQREGWSDRLLTRAQNLRERLGGSGSMFDLFPEKPKGMHWRTYARLRQQGQMLDAMQWSAVAERFHLTD